MRTLSDSSFIFTGMINWQEATVLQTLGYDEIDCIVIEIDKTKEKALNIALNKITGEWNQELLADLIED